MVNERRLWTSARIKRVAFTVVLALLATIGLTGVIDSAGTSSVMRGDFPAFYAAARILASEQASRLYDPLLQAQIQKAHWPSFVDQYLYFAYPPAVALLLTPLASLSALTAKFLWGALMFSLLLLTVIVLQKLRGLEKTTFLPLLAVCLGCAPVYSSIAAGQNTALSMFLYALLLLLLRKNAAVYDILAGIVLGLWLFKPHFALIAFVFVLFQGRWRTLIGFAIPAGAYFILGAYVMGPGWPQIWLTAVKEFSLLDSTANQHQMISIFGVSKALAAMVSAKTQWYAILGAVIGGLVTFYAARELLRSRKNISGGADALLLVGPLVVLLSPHTLYYDFGIFFISLVLLGRTNSDRDIWSIIGFEIILFLFLLLKSELAFQPLAIVAILSFPFICSRISASRLIAGETILPQGRRGKEGFKL